MARYNRDKKGRFASKGGGGAGGPKIKRKSAGDTRIAGKMDRADMAGLKGKGRPNLSLPAGIPRGNSQTSPRQARRRMDAMYKGDPLGLRSDIRITRRRGQTLDQLLDL